MSTNFISNSKLLIISALATILNIGLLANLAQAQPINKNPKPRLKVSASKTQSNRLRNLHSFLSRTTTSSTGTPKNGQQDIAKLSQTKQIIPLPKKSLIANFFDGKASWYGPGFHGRTTASGEIYNQNDLTAAHPNLEFGTKVKVTNLTNGQSVIVKINDRGPYAQGRIIDLSAAAARALGIITSGVAPVKITILGI
jgi:rare lipoprotein A